MTSIYVGIPTTGAVKTGCTSSLINLAKDMERRGIQNLFRIMSNADVVAARNIIASTFVERSETHLLFIDSDISFKPSALTRMLNENQPFIDCAYPRRDASRKPVVYPEGLSFAGPVVEVGGMGMGLCLIRRDVFERLTQDADLRVGPPNPALGIAKSTFGFFDQITTKGDLISEDLSFCMRWRRTRGKLLAIMDEDIGHIGDFTFTAR